MQSWPLMAAAIVAFLAVGILQLTPPEEVTPGAERETAVRSPAPRRVEPESAKAPEAPAANIAASETAAPVSPPDASKTLSPGASAVGDGRGEPNTAVTQRERAPERKKAQTPETAGSIDALKEKQTRATADTAQAPSRADADTLGAAASKLPAAPGATPAPLPPPAQPFPAAPSPSGSTPTAAGNAQATLPAQRNAPLPSSTPSAADASAPAKSDRAAGQASAPVPLAKSSAEGAKDAPKPRDEWIKLIRRLRSEGHNEEALREITAFRAAYKERADELLPADLRSLR